MNTYTKFLVKNYLMSLLNVFLFFCLIYVLNLLTELEFLNRQMLAPISHFIYL